MSKTSLLLIMIVAMSVFNFSSAVFSEFSQIICAKASGLLIQTTGFIGLALSSECTATRNPILESICACLGDLPGGYCYHLSCGIVGIPVMTEQPDQIQIIHK